MTASQPTELPDAPSFRLDGKRALVTGAGRGIGLAAASALAAAGAEVTLAARTQAEIEDAAATPSPPAASARRPWCSTCATSTPCRDRCRCGALPCAGQQRRHQPAGALHAEVTVEDFDFVAGLNVRSAFFVAQAVARGLLAAKRPGSIINVSSQMGHVGAARRTRSTAPPSTRWKA